MTAPKLVWRRIIVWAIDRVQDTAPRRAVTIGLREWPPILRPLQQLRQLGGIDGDAPRLIAVSLLKQRFGPVAPAMKFVHWVCEEMDQRFAGYSV
jgi:hypothetical protein